MDSRAEVLLNQVTWPMQDTQAPSFGKAGGVLESLLDIQNKEGISEQTSCLYFFQIIINIKTIAV